MHASRCADSGSKRQQQHDVAHLSRLKAELAALLRRTVMPRSLSRKFPTREENHQLLDGYRGAYTCGPVNGGGHYIGVIGGGHYIVVCGGGHYIGVTASGG